MKTRLDIKDRDPVLTAVVGDNSDLIKQVADIYIPDDVDVLDATYGNGVFWKDIETGNFFLTTNDIDPERGQYSYDFREFPTHWDEEFDVVILDPPYMYHSSTIHKKSIDRGYQNNVRVEEGIHGVEAVNQYFLDGMAEAYRVLRDGGLLWVKCMDQIMSGKQWRQHIFVFNMAMELGFTDEDLFTLVQTGIPTMRHKYQLHARKNNSFLWVFRK